MQKEGECVMKLIEAVSTRILNLCDERNISVNKLAILSGITQSTLSGIVNMNFVNPKTLTILRICRGLDMEIYEFFDDDIFKDIDDD